MESYSMYLYVLVAGDLVSSTQRKDSEIHSCCVYQLSTPFSYGVGLHHTDILQFVYPLTCR